jgi:hypothetical protein
MSGSIDSYTDVEVCPDRASNTAKRSQERAAYLEQVFNASPGHQHQEWKKKKSERPHAEYRCCAQRH